MRRACIPLQPLLLLALLACHVLSPWAPAAAQTAAPAYDPRTKDWASVIAACKDVGAQEKRLMNFVIRTSFHDSLSVTQVNCKSGCGGADGSLMLNMSEMVRPENSYETFSETTSKFIRKIATFYNVSASDTLAVCAMVAPSVLNPQVDLFKYGNLRVGKLDNSDATPPGQLPPVDVTTEALMKFFKDRGFTPEEGVALLGTHSLLDEQTCFRGRNNDPRDWCNPYIEKCDNVRMFQFDNHYYVDSCTPSVRIPTVEMAPDLRDPPVALIDPAEFLVVHREETCKFTSNFFRQNSLELLAKERAGIVKPTDKPMDEVYFTNDPARCPSSKLPAAINNNCPHVNHWMFLKVDANLAVSCQKGDNVTTPNTLAAGSAMLKYAVENEAWIATYGKAYIKMVSTNANYAPGLPFYLTGRECPSGWRSRRAFRKASSPDHKICAQTCSNAAVACPSYCMCSTSFLDGIAYKVPSQAPQTVRVVDFPYAPPVGPFTEPLVPETFEPFVDPFPDLFVDAFGDAFGAAFGEAPGDTNPNCPSTNAPYEVNGWPGSPMVLTPFRDEYVEPSVKEFYKDVGCRADGKCMKAAEIDIVEVRARTFDKVAPYCRTVKGYKGTWWMGYDGKIPGPMIRLAPGNESLIRFNNKIKGNYYPLGSTPCAPRLGRPYGRPVSIHLHGSPSLPPYDGWADDVTCSGESKDYIYPNNKPSTAWYHDHAFHETADNAYSGLAGFYIADDSTAMGGCGAPWNLDNVEQRHLMLADKLLDDQCQLSFEKEGRHRNSLYGDINVVSGIPWPVMRLEAKWYRFRFVNAGPSRPYMLKIKNQRGMDVQQLACYVIATDEGYREPVVFPADGLIIGVAERYEIVCDFGKFPGQTLYLWNDRDAVRFKNVPYFCFSHLLAKIVVGPADVQTGLNGQFDLQLNPATRPDKVLLSDDDLYTALERASKGEYDRKFVFGRRNGHWVINGESWETMQIAAPDVGQNTWELWLLKTGGGWFHPIHIHLISFFVVLRNTRNNGGVFNYESFAAKDVVYLGPGDKIWVVARYGPHRGNYMFHCHNLVHEDDDMLRAFNVSMGPEVEVKPKIQGPFVTLNGQVKAIYSNWGYNNPLYDGSNAKVSSLWPKIDKKYINAQVAKNLHPIFYPTAADAARMPGLDNVTYNPWMVQCPARGGT